jgi:hypothetical protein
MMLYGGRQCPLKTKRSVSNGAVEMRSGRFDDPDYPAYLDRCATPDFKRIGGTWYFRIESTGEILEANVRVMCVEEWNACPEASDPTWRPMDFGELVVAVKTLCG